MEDILAATPDKVERWDSPPTPDDDDDDDPGEGDHDDGVETTTAVVQPDEGVETLEDDPAAPNNADEDPEVTRPRLLTDNEIHALAVTLDSFCDIRRELSDIAMVSATW